MIANMSKLRIAPLPLEDFRAVQRSLGQDAPGPPLNVLATVARNPELYDAWLRFGGAVNADALPARERELIILRTAWRCGSGYEWAQHAGFARTAGLSDAEIRRVAADGDGGEGWEAGEALLLRTVDELVDSHRVADDTWEALAERYPEAVLLQIFLLAGHYVMLAGLLNSVGVEVESEGMASLGQAPD
jgi:4-carboxymuconolactone decarboxylase